MLLTLGDASAVLCVPGHNWKKSRRSDCTGLLSPALDKGFSYSLSIEHPLQQPAIAKEDHLDWAVTVPVTCCIALRAPVPIVTHLLPAKPSSAIAFPCIPSLPIP
ncbi:hypothetical protein G7K_3724-t1 [Saitoella complicata NRRL Y-17804]|uniref:Uncharacterized protein n=1 Tax=Saitoella complicata (strain BCRC 22490 / CBS 7301 / JCM 7358 / NBRC 10748 / NRRL Y-17804) TaxID=698492 RepID=A0A0E9NJJ5_SAICN|nr:hypothetical protein G7K_3724-t1 [Saitoella complicata NRRL Y-17804]